MADTATRLRILASVEGIQGFNQLKASLQGLAQQGSSTRYDLFKLTEAYGQLKRSGDSTIAGMRLQVQALTQLRENYKIGSTAFREYGAELDRVRAKLQATTREAAGGGAAGGGAGAGLIGGLAARFIAPIATGATVAAVGGAGMEAEAAQTRLKALTDQYGEYTKAQASAATVAQTLRLSTAEAQGQFASLYASLRPVGVTVKEIEDAMIGFGAAARNSGATAQETSNAMIQLRQALASGVLQGEELRSIREQAPLVAQAIAKEMRVPIGALKDLAAEGKVTSDVVLRALGKLRDTQLGKLNAQFATTQQAVTDLGNAFKDTSAELFKLFGPTVISGLKLLTGLLKGVGDGLSKSTSDWSAYGQAAKEAERNYPGDQNRQRQYIQERVIQLQQTQKLLQSGGNLTYTSGGITYDARTGQPVSAQQAKVLRSIEAQARGDVVSPEARAEQERARLEGLSRGAGGKKEEAKLPEYISKEQFRAWLRTRGFERTTGDFTNRGHRTPNHMLNAMDMGILGGSDAEALRRTGEMERLLQATGAFGDQLFGPTRDPYGHGAGKGGQNIHLHIPTPGGLVKMNPALASLMGIAGAGQGGKYALAQGLMDAESEQAKKAQKAAEKRANEQREYGLKRQEEADQNQEIYNQLQAQIKQKQAITEEDKIRAEYGVKIADMEGRLNEEVSKMVDPVQILIREELRRNEIYQTRIDMLQEIADLQTKQQAERDSAAWADQQLSLNETLSQYYQRQADKLQEQNVYAESLSQTLGQGMQQAFSLAIQGADDLSAKLQELGATVLKDIAQQLIQISIIAPIVRGIAGIGGGGGISPIAPGVGAAGGADFAKFFLQAGASAFAGGGGGLPGVNFTGLGSTGFGFANGGIMTPQGPVPLRTYARGGIATAPQAAIYGEGSTPEAFVPLPDGRRIPVQLRQYPGIPGAPGTPGGFEQTDEVVRQLVTQARQDSTAAATTAAAAGGDGTMRIQLETTRINSVDYITAEQAAALANAAAARSTARQQRALQASPGARRGIGI